MEKVSSDVSSFTHFILGEQANINYSRFHKFFILNRCTAVQWIIIQLLIVLVQQDQGQDFIMLQVPALVSIFFILIIIYINYLIRNEIMVYNTLDSNYLIIQQTLILIVDSAFQIAHYIYLFKLDTTSQYDSLKDQHLDTEYSTSLEKLLGGHQAFSQQIILLWMFQIKFSIIEIQQSFQMKLFSLAMMVVGVGVFMASVQLAGDKVLVCLLITVFFQTVVQTNSYNSFLDMCTEFDERRTISDQGFLDLRNKMNATKFIFKNSSFNIKKNSTSTELIVNFKQLGERLNNLYYLDLLFNNTYKVKMELIKLDEFCSKLSKLCRLYLMDKNNKVTITLKKSTQNQIKTDQVLMRYYLCMIMLILHELNFKHIKITILKSDTPNSLTIFFNFFFNGFITPEQSRIQEDMIIASRKKFQALIETYNGIETIQNITNNEVQLELLHKADIDEKINNITTTPQDYNWEYDSKQTDIVTSWVDPDKVTEKEDDETTSLKDSKVREPVGRVELDTKEVAEEGDIEVQVQEDEFGNAKTVEHVCSGIINVDDEEGILKMHQMLFKRFNKAKVNMCKSGAQLQDLLFAISRCSTCKVKPLTILVDQMMDNEWGTDVVREAKEKFDSVLEMNFFGLSSNEDQKTENLFLSVGVKKVLGKPLNIKKIKEIFAN